MNWRVPFWTLEPCVAGIAAAVVVEPAPEVTVKGTWTLSIGLPLESVAWRSRT